MHAISEAPNPARRPGDGALSRSPAAGTARPDRQTDERPRASGGHPAAAAGTAAWNAWPSTGCGPAHRGALAGRGGTNFSELVDALRDELLERYLDEDARSLAEIEKVLGFAAASGFARWHR